MRPVRHTAGNGGSTGSGSGSSGCVNGNSFLSSFAFSLKKRNITGNATSSNTTTTTPTTTTWDCTPYLPPRFTPLPEIEENTNSPRGDQGGGGGDKSQTSTSSTVTPPISSSGKSEGGSGGGVNNTSITSVLVNYPPPSHFYSIWKSSTHRICCDGGFNILIHLLSPSHFNACPPEVVIGDLDSISQTFMTSYTTTTPPPTSPSTPESDNNTTNTTSTTSTTTNDGNNNNGTTEDNNKKRSPRSGGDDDHRNNNHNNDNNNNNDNVSASSMIDLQNHDGEGEMIEKRRTDNIKLIRDPNQNNTDLDKALLYLTSHQQQQEGEDEIVSSSHPIIDSDDDDHAICVLGGLGGNLSQILGNINTLYLFAHLKIYLLSNDNLSILLRKGKNRIRLREGMYCSIIPFTSSDFNASNTPGDLKYPLDGIDLKFGGIISTSNETMADEITIDVPAPCLFTLDFR